MPYEGVTDYHITAPRTEEIIFSEGEAEIVEGTPVVTDGPPAQIVNFDPVVITARAPRTERITFEETEVEAITATTRGYDGVIVFDESQVEPITVPVREFTFEEGEVEAITASLDPYDGVIIFEESEVEPVTAPVRELTFEEGEVEPIIGPLRPYEGIIIFEELEAEPITVPVREFTFAEGEGETVTGDLPASTRKPKSSAYQGILAPPALANWPPLVRRPVREGYISFELAEAWKLPVPSLPLSVTVVWRSLAERQVISWLQLHAAEIVAAEKKWRIDRRAIAGAIAWEALENVWPTSLRAVGPGKVHVKAPVVEQVEQRGLLPRRTAREREAILKTASGAIEYIGAIMAAMADIAEVFGHDIRCRSDILTNEYQGRDLLAWTAHLVEKKDDQFRPGNTMGVWTQQNLWYLELGVGRPDSSICSRP